MTGTGVLVRSVCGDDVRERIGGRIAYMTLEQSLARCGRGLHLWISTLWAMDGGVQSDHQKCCRCDRRRVMRRAYPERRWRRAS